VGSAAPDPARVSIVVIRTFARAALTKPPTSVQHRRSSAEAAAPGRSQRRARSRLTHQPFRDLADQQPRADVRIHNSFDTAIDGQLAGRSPWRAPLPSV